jgi:murein DD-endopeptidase MepM/ murein hydrolase activator NlpD
MSEQDKQKKRFFRRLKIKYRLVIMNDETFEEKASFVLSPLSVFVFVGSVALFLITLVTYIIAFTPLREYIPGYTDVTLKHNMEKVALRADSMEEAMKAKDLYIQNIQNIISGQAGVGDSSKTVRPGGGKEEYTHLHVSPSETESELRKKVETEDKYSLAFSEEKSSHGSIAGFFFFVPLAGNVTSSFNTAESHYGVDIVGKKNEAIKATLDGSVIFAGWTSETGYVIQVQHSNDLVSIYKHNSVLLKKAGDKVKAGEAIAIIGESGELSTGPHLHFELWNNGRPIDPQDYMSFK